MIRWSYKRAARSAASRGLQRPADTGIAGLAVTAVNGNYELYVSESGRDDVSTMSNAGFGTAFQHLTCFDAIAAPVRLAASVLPDGSPEIAGVSSCGHVYERHQSPDTNEWLAWAAVGIAGVNDVALAHDAQRTYLFAATNSGVFENYYDGAAAGRVTPNARNMVAGAAQRIAAGIHSDGRRRIFMLSATGAPSTSVQIAPGLSSAYLSFVDFGGEGVPAFVDIATVDGLPLMEVFGLDSMGVIWHRIESDDPQGFSEWQALNLAAPAERLTRLAAAASPGDPGQGAVLVAGGEKGNVLALQRIDAVWQDEWAILF